MLPKENRLRKDFEIKKAYKAKFRSRTKFTQILLSKSPLPPFQLLVVISKKVFKKANKRHRVKRKILALFANLNKEKRLPGQVLCIVLVNNPEILKQSSEEISLDLFPTIRKLYLKLSNFS